MGWKIHPGCIYTSSYTQCRQLKLSTNAPSWSFTKYMYVTYLLVCKMIPYLCSGFRHIADLGWQTALFSTGTVHATHFSATPILTFTTFQRCESLLSKYSSAFLPGVSTQIFDSKSISQLIALSLYVLVLLIVSWHIQCPSHPLYHQPTSQMTQTITFVKKKMTYLWDNQACHQEQAPLDVARRTESGMMVLVKETKGL